MRVVIYSGAIPSTTFIERLITGLAENGVKVLVCGYKTKAVNYPGLKIKVIGYSGTIGRIWIALKYGFLFSLIDQKSLIKLFQAHHVSRNNYESFFHWFAKSAPIVWHKPDIFHLQWAKNTEKWLFLKDFGIKIIVSFRGAHINYSPIVNSALAESYRQCFPKVNGFHGVSQAICREGTKYSADHTKCKVVYSGLKTSEFDYFEDKPFDPSLIKIISIGRAHWKKGYDIALDAVRILKDQEYNFHYQIVGGLSEEMIFQVSDLCLQDKVTLTENLPFEKIKELISQADVLLLPSVEEGIPNVVLEAMALGTLIISTNCGGLEEVITDGENGFLVPIYDPEAIAEKLVNITKLRPPEINRIRTSARRKVESHHTDQLMIAGMKSLYQTVIKRK